MLNVRSGKRGVFFSASKDGKKAVVVYRPWSVGVVTIILFGLWGGTLMVHARTSADGRSWGLWVLTALLNMVVLLGVFLVGYRVAVHVDQGTGRFLYKSAWFVIPLRILAGPLGEIHEVELRTKYRAGDPDSGPASRSYEILLNILGRKLLLAMYSSFDVDDRAASDVAWHIAQVAGCPFQKRDS